MNIAKAIDTSGLLCPIPLLRTKKAIKTMATGEVLKIITTDPAAIADIGDLCKMLNHRLLKTEKTQTGSFIIWLQVG